MNDCGHYRSTRLATGVVLHPYAGPRLPFLPRLAFVAATFGCLLLATPPARAQGISGTVNYTGNLGPVNGRRPLCLCLYSDANLRHALGCLIFSSSRAPFRINTFNTNNYYLIAFLDIDLNETVDANEPFEIYHDRGAPPADALQAGSDFPSADLTFGDENLPGSASPTPTATLVPTATPTPSACSGDCDASGDVTIDEIIHMVNIALGSGEPAACTAGDTDGNGTIDITEIVTAVSNAAAGCPGG